MHSTSLQPDAPAPLAASPRPVGAALQAASDGHLVIDVARLDEDGESFEGEIPVDQLDLDPADPLYRPKSGLRYSIHVRFIDGLLFATGSAEEDFDCTCVRCADDFVWTAFDDEVDFSVEAEENSFLDLTDSLRECIILSLPSNPLCREDCKGLCQHCGRNLNKESCSCSHGSDGRWGALDGLTME